MGTIPDFSNTQQAFAYKSNQELKGAIRLFRLFNFPILVKWGPKLTVWALRMHLPIRNLVRTWVFNYFCGGEDMNECDATARKMNALGVKSILDYSVEGVAEELQFDANRDEIRNTIFKAGDSDYYPFAVFKTTGIIRFELLEIIQSGKTLNFTEEKEWENGKERFESLCREAAARKVKLFVDAEESWIQEPIDRLVEEMMERYNTENAWVYNTLQMYRHDRLAYLKSAIATAGEKAYFCGYKLVRGAYMEKERERAKEKGYPSPIQPDKATSDRHYNEALRICFERRERVSVCAGTHNEESSALLSKLMLDNAIEPSDERFWFAQLYGMSDHISFNLAASGFNVAKYLPYGPLAAVMPYLSRRAEENTSVAGQMGRELKLLTAEWQRRINEH